MDLAQVGVVPPSDVLIVQDFDPQRFLNFLSAALQSLLEVKVLGLHLILECKLGLLLSLLNLFRFLLVFLVQVVQTSV